jgi:hypothetical protein
MQVDNQSSAFVSIKHGWLMLAWLTGSSHARLEHETNHALGRAMAYLWPSRTRSNGVVWIEVKQSFHR